MKLELQKPRNPGGINVKNLGSSGKNALRKKEKVILVVGATGSGKSTWINSLFNYVMGVGYDDDFRFKLVTEVGKSQAHSQTQHITIYTDYITWMGWLWTSHSLLSTLLDLVIRMVSRKTDILSKSFVPYLITKREELITSMPSVSLFNHLLHA